MLKQGFIGLISLASGIIILIAVNAPSAAAITTTAPNAGPCDVVSCTVYLPIILKPIPAITPQFEVTQGIQQPDNSVRLIAGRTTYVRWTLTAPAATSGVSAYLTGTRDGVPLAGSPLAALNNARTVGTTANRAVLNDTFNFQLPADWTNGTVNLSASANNASGFITYTTAQAFQFSTTPNMAVKVVPIAYHCTSGGSGTTTPTAPYDYLIDYTFRTYPVPGITLSTHAPVPFNGRCNSSGVPLPWSSSDPNNFTYWEDMLTLMTNVWIADGRPNTYYYGLLHLDCGGGCVAGIGWIGGYQAAVGFDGFGTAHSGASDTHAHELGHNHGRYHAPGCGASGPDPSFPYLDGSSRALIGNAANPNYGFDLNSLAIYTYGSYFDIMNYCDPQWVSDYTYEAWWQYDNVTLAAQRPGTGNRSLLISGSIDPLAQRASFEPVYAVDVPARSSTGGDYTLELLDQRGSLLAAYPFAAITAQPDRTDEGRSNELVGFHLNVPYVSGVSTLRVKHGTTILGTRQAKSSAPILSTPVNRSGQISWSGRELDGEPLHYLVRTSIDDGVTWETIGFNLTQPTVTLDPEFFGGQTVRVEVIASDGLNSTQQVLGPFNGPNK